MSFDERTLSQLYDAKRQASRLLIMEGVLVRDLVPDEALVLQAASYVLTTNETFTEPQLIAITEYPRRSINYMLERFVNIDLIEIQKRVGGPGRRGKPLRLFGSTELGSKVLALFQEPNT